MAEGLVGHLGFSTHGPLEVIEETINTDEFESVNLHYYYVNPRNLPAVQLARSKDMGVFIISRRTKAGNCSIRRRSWSISVLPGRRYR